MASPRVLRLLVVWLSVSWCCAVASATGTGTFRGPDDAAVAIDAPLVQADASPPPPPLRPQSQCAACRDWATCDLAFRGRPGKYCHDLWWDGRECCCPLGAQCIWDFSRCLCKDMLFGEATPKIMGVIVGVIVLLWLAVTIYQCYFPSPPTTSSSGGGASDGTVAEHSRVFSQDRNYGTVFSGDTGDSGTFAGDAGDSGGTFSGDS